MDALDERVRALESERLRPDAKPRTTDELLGDLVKALHSLYRTTPDAELSTGGTGSCAQSVRTPTSRTCAGGGESARGSGPVV